MVGARRLKCHRDRNRALLPGPQKRRTGGTRPLAKMLSGTGGSWSIWFSGRGPRFREPRKSARSRERLIGPEPEWYREPWRGELPSLPPSSWDVLSALLSKQRGCLFPRSIPFEIDHEQRQALQTPGFATSLFAHEEKEALMGCGFRNQVRKGEGRSRFESELEQLRGFGIKL